MIFNEDLYVPGYFEISIKKGESVTFSGGVTPIETTSLNALFAAEMEQRTPRDNFKNCLINSTHQFLNKQDGESYILAGYPWFKCRARDIFISLPGLTLSIGEIGKFEMIMETALKAVYAFMEGKDSHLKVTEIEHPDVLLWLVWTIQQYAKMVSWDEARVKYGKALKDVMDYLAGNHHPNLKVHENGLVYTNGRDKSCYMDELYCKWSSGSCSHRICGGI